MKQAAPDYAVRDTQTVQGNPIKEISSTSRFWSGVKVYATTRQWQSCLDDAARYFPERDQEQVAAGYAWSRL